MSSVEITGTIVDVYSGQPIAGRAVQIVATASLTTIIPLGSGDLPPGATHPTSGTEVRSIVNTTVTTNAAGQFSASGAIPSSSPTLGVSVSGGRPTIDATVTVATASGSTLASQSQSSQGTSFRFDMVVGAGPTLKTADAEPFVSELSWSSPAGATSYNVYRASAAGAEGARSAYQRGVSGTTYVDPAPFVNAYFYYQVSAVTPYGESAKSNEVGYWQSPPAPTNLKATPKDSAVVLSWSPVAHAATYNVYRFENGAQTARFTGVQSSSYTDTGLTNGTTYVYDVSASATNGDEGPSAGDVSATPVADTSAATLTGGLVFNQIIGDAPATGAFVITGTCNPPLGTGDGDTSFTRADQFSVNPGQNVSWSFPPIPNLKRGTWTVTWTVISLAPKLTCSGISVPGNAVFTEDDQGTWHCPNAPFWGRRPTK